MKYYWVSSVVSIVIAAFLILRRIFSGEHNQENFLSKWLIKIIQKLFLDCPRSVRYWFEECGTEFTREPD